MQLKLVLFIKGERTFDSYDYPLKPDIEITDPVEVYYQEHDIYLHANPEKEIDLYSLDHEYKIIMVED